MKAFLVGVPKSGTMTIHKAFLASGLKSAHWKVPEGFCGELIYRADRAGRDPLARLLAYDCIAQADVCLPGRNINFWPNLDIGVLKRIRAHHPECVFVLNHRAPEKIAASIARWGNLQSRLVRAEIPGLPAGIGSTIDELEAWIAAHFAACRSAFAGDPAFLDLDIERRDAQKLLSKALQTDLAWWGVANAGGPRRLQRQPQEKPPGLARIRRIARRRAGDAWYHLSDPDGFVWTGLRRVRARIATDRPPRQGQPAE
jgi:hypothetical protein